MNDLTRRKFLAGAAAAAALPLGSQEIPKPRSTLAQETMLDEVRSGRPIRAVEVIDTHGHIGDTLPGAVWPRNADLLIQAMDRCGTSQIVISPLRAILATTIEELRIAHDECVQVAARYPGRVRFYVVFQPYLIDASRAQLQRILAPGSPFCGIKLHGAVHNYPVNGPAYKIPFEFAQEHALPVLLHIGPGIETVGSIAARYPRMKLILAHFGGGSPMVLKWARDLQNVWVDTPTSNGPRRIIEHLKDACGVDKILYGSDSVYLGMGSQIARIAFSRITDDEKRRIYGVNARTVFGQSLAPPV